MQSRRDQVQAYFYVVGRLAAAVTHGRPDVLQAPNRRLNTGMVLSALLAAVIAGIFGIYGLFKPGGDTTWQQEGAIVMDDSTGARYVYLAGQLRPVLNYSSARLASGQSSSGQIYSVSANSLAGTPVGQPIGIQGAPDALPSSGGLATGPWTVCAQSAGSGPAASGETVTLLLHAPDGAPTSNDQALLVSTPDGVNYLVWQGKRHRIGDRGAAQTLGYGDVAATKVAPSWLNPIPQGQDISVPATVGAGQPGPSIDGEPGVVGRIYEVRNPAIGTTQLYLLRSDGIAPLTRTSAALLLAAPQTKAAYPGSPVTPIEVGPAALTNVSRSNGPDLVAGMPAEPPEVVSPPPNSYPCMRFTPSAAGEMQATAELLSAGAVDSTAMPVAAHVAGTTADKVSIPAGGGVLARDLPAPGAAPGPAYLITETGTRYPLADTDVLGALGYSESSVVRVPAQLLNLLPAGPLLSSEGAVTVVDPKRAGTS